MIQTQEDQKTAPGRVVTILQKINFCQVIAFCLQMVLRTVVVFYLTVQARHKNQLSFQIIVWVPMLLPLRQEKA